MSLAVVEFAPEDEYTDVVHAIRRALATMESYPAAYETQGEEALRHVLVTALEVAFAGSASAEALRGSGKTDILVRINGRVVYIGECKVWAGQVALHDAIDQLLGYGTWRDHGLGLVVFVRGKRMRRTLARATTAIEEHSGFRGWRPEDPEEPTQCLLAQFAQKVDQDGEATVAVQFAHLPTSRSERIGGGVDDVGAGLEVLLGLRESVLEPGDEPIDYRASLGTGSAPLAPEPGSLMRFERIGPKGRAAIDAVPQTEEAADRYRPAGAVEFVPGSHGERARMLIDEARSWGVGVEVEGGFNVRLDRYPPGMHAAVERLEESETARMLLRPSTKGAWPVELRVSTDRGEAAVGIHLHVVSPPPEGWDVALRGHFQNLSVTYSLTRATTATSQQSGLHWAVHPTDASVRDRLAALDFLYAMSGGGTIEIISGLAELPSARIELADSPLDAETLFERAFFADIVTLEEWAGRRFDLPDSASAEQIQIVAAAASAVRSRSWVVRWERLTFQWSEAVPTKLDDWRAERFLMPLDAEIFGEHVRLGFGRADLHFDIESVETCAEDPARRAVTIVPHDEASAVVEARDLEPVSSEAEGSS